MKKSADFEWFWFGSGVVSATLSLLVNCIRRDTAFECALCEAAKNSDAAVYIFERASQQKVHLHPVKYLPALEIFLLQNDRIKITFRLMESKKHIHLCDWLYTI